jgi:hypothetical protein
LSLRSAAIFCKGRHASSARNATRAWREGTQIVALRCEKEVQLRSVCFNSGAFDMSRGLILWLVGIPLPVILILYFLGYLH